MDGRLARISLNLSAFSLSLYFNLLCGMLLHNVLHYDTVQTINAYIACKTEACS